MPSLNPIFHIVCCTVLVAALTSLPSPARVLTIENTAFANNVTIGEKRVSLRGAAPLRWLKLEKVTKQHATSLSKQSLQTNLPTSPDGFR